MRLNLISGVTRQQAIISWSTIQGSRFINIKFYSNEGYSNSLNSFKIIILVIDCLSYSPNVANWKTTWDYNLPFKTNFNASSLYSNPLTEYRCIYGFTKLER